MRLAGGVRDREIGPGNLVPQAFTTIQVEPGLVLVGMIPHLVAARDGGLQR